MTPREHFKTIDAFYINRDADVNRRNRLESEFDGVFKSLTRVEPVKFEDMKLHGIDFKKRLIEAGRLDYRGLLKNVAFKDINIDRFASRKLRKEKSNSPYTPEQYAATESLALTDKKILEEFIASGKDRCIILEDDAVPRWSVLDDVNSIPDSDFIIWGMTMNGTIPEAKLFVEMEHPEFRKLKGKGCNCGSQAYEVTRAGAEAFLSLFDRFPAVIIDQTWSYLFDDMDCYALCPVGIVQKSPSIASSISSRGYDMPVTREEAAELIRRHQMISE